MPPGSDPAPAHAPAGELLRAGVERTLPPGGPVPIAFEGGPLLERLRALEVAARVGPVGGDAANAALDEFAASGVRFASSATGMEAQYYRAVRELMGCIKPVAGTGPILHEGGVYHGCWLESTGTISAELLSRFVPSVAEATFLGFAAHQREDGLFPYKLTADGAVCNQIQLVTPLARSVWNHYRLNGRNRAFLQTMFAAMARYDGWLARFRDTRGTGGVEAFSTYDTGHDLSARFWHAPDSPFGNDPKAVDPDSPILPFIAPDLTANVACQRSYLAQIADELDEAGAGWDAKATRSVQALFRCCYNAEDGFFYDLDRHDRYVRVQSDVLLRVLACEIGDDDFFAMALRRYLLNTRKFFARYPFTSIALDDPRFDPAFEYNSWSGPSNLLSLIRAPHAFEHHGRHVELTFAMQPILMALGRAERFAQCLSPFTGAAGYTEAYSPAMLCLIDFVERLCGILPRPEGTLWFTCLTPRQLEHRDARHETAYSRTVDGHRFELVNSLDGAGAWRDGEPIFRCPQGVRVVTDRAGTPVSLIGMSVSDIEGVLDTPDGAVPFRIGPNEQLELQGGQPQSVRPPGYIPPSY